MEHTPKDAAPSATAEGPGAAARAAAGAASGPAAAATAAAAKASATAPAAESKPKPDWKAARAKLIAKELGKRIPKAKPVWRPPDLYIYIYCFTEK